MKTKPGPKVGGQHRAKPAKTQSKTAGPHVFRPKEFKVVALRSCPWRDGRPMVETPEAAADYFRRHVATHRRFNSDVESLVVLLLNVRHRLLGHALVSQGTVDTVLVRSGEVFRPAIVANAAAVVLMHNHPSGDPTPSESDLRVTRDLIRAGQALKIELLDHVIMGKPEMDQKTDYMSLKELGYFYADGPESVTLSKAAEAPRRVKPERKRRGGRVSKTSWRKGWVPAARSGIANPGAGRRVKETAHALRHSEEHGFYLFDERRTCTLNGKPCGDYAAAQAVTEHLRDRMSRGTVKLSFTYEPAREMVKRLTRAEAVAWSIEAFLPECFRGDVKVTTPGNTPGRRKKA